MQVSIGKQDAFDLWEIVQDECQLAFGWQKTPVSVGLADIKVNGFLIGADADGCFNERTFHVLSACRPIFSKVEGFIERWIKVYFQLGEAMRFRDELQYRSHGQATATPYEQRQPVNRCVNGYCLPTFDLFIRPEVIPVTLWEDHPARSGACPGDRAEH